MIENLAVYSGVILAALGLFSAIARITPNKADNKIADALWKFVNKLGLRGGPTLCVLLAWTLTGCMHGHLERFDPKTGRKILEIESFAFGATTTEQFAEDGGYTYSTKSGGISTNAKELGLAGMAAASKATPIGAGVAVIEKGIEALDNDDEIVILLPILESELDTDEKLDE